MGQEQEKKQEQQQPQRAVQLTVPVGLTEVEKEMLLPVYRDIISVSQRRQEVGATLAQAQQAFHELSGQEFALNEVWRRISKTVLKSHGLPWDERVRLDPEKGQLEVPPDLEPLLREKEEEGKKEEE